MARYHNFHGDANIINDTRADIRLVNFPCTDDGCPRPHAHVLTDDEYAALIDDGSVRDGVRDAGRGLPAGQPLWRGIDVFTRDDVERIIEAAITYADDAPLDWHLSLDDERPVELRTDHGAIIAAALAGDR